MVDQRQRRYLDAMGIPVWERREPPVPAVPESPAGQPTAEDVPPPATAGEDLLPAYEAWFEEMETEPDVAGFEPAARPRDDVSALDWEGLQTRVRDCGACEQLVANRTQTVFGVGNPDADWLIVGEAPGADEDKQGEPFVGRAGQLLNAMLKGIGLDRDEVYIANILKCRPPNNRDPRPEEADRCRPFLRRQIALIRPKVILAVGRIAAQNLLLTDAPLGRLRGCVHRFEDTGIPVIVTYHPAYLLRKPVEKRKAWEDLKFARREMAGSGTAPP
jgi:DNA polymerase